MTGMSGRIYVLLTGLPKGIFREDHNISEKTARFSYRRGLSPSDGLLRIKVWYIFPGKAEDLRKEQKVFSLKEKISSQRRSKSQRVENLLKEEQKIFSGMCINSFQGEQKVFF